MLLNAKPNLESFDADVLKVREQQHVVYGKNGYTVRECLEI